VEAFQWDRYLSDKWALLKKSPSFSNGQRSSDRWSRSWPDLQPNQPINHRRPQDFFLGMETDDELWKWRINDSSTERFAIHKTLYNISRGVGGGASALLHMLAEAHACLMAMPYISTMCRWRSLHFFSELSLCWYHFYRFVKLWHSHKTRSFL